MVDVVALYCSLHALKDESFLRQTLQKQAAQLHQAAVSYAVSIITSHAIQTCQEAYSVKHVLIDCTDLGLIRSRFYHLPYMKILFDTVNVDRILTFIKEVNLFSKI